MNIIIFGASGKTGSELVSQALSRGHRVTAFVRSPQTLSVGHPNLVLARGDVTNPDAVDAAIRDQHAVLSALGAPSPMRRYPALTVGLAHIVTSMARLGVPRLIYLSFLGVAAGRRQLPGPFRHLVSFALRHAIADHEANEALIVRSSLAWTIVRAPKLTNGRGTGNYRSGEAIRGSWPVPLVPRADVAHFMLEQLENERYVRKAPAVLR